MADLMSFHPTYAIKAFKSHPLARAQPPFVFMTGYGAVDQAVRMLELGAADYASRSTSTHWYSASAPSAPRWSRPPEVKGRSA